MTDEDAGEKNDGEGGGGPKPGQSRLETLPTAVLEKVCGLLGLQDLIRLKMASRFFRSAVDPVRQCQDTLGMWEFVEGRLQAIEREERAMKTWWRRKKQICFGCFRPRLWHQFSPQQRKLSQMDRLRRRCWECLRRFYHPQLADTEARDKFNKFSSNVICRRCNLLRFPDENCRGCGDKFEECKFHSMALSASL